MIFFNVSFNDFSDVFLGRLICDAPSECRPCNLHEIIQKKTEERLSLHEAINILQTFARESCSPNPPLAQSSYAYYGHCMVKKLCVSFGPQSETINGKKFGEHLLNPQFVMGDGVEEETW